MGEAGVERGFDAGESVFTMFGHVLVPLSLCVFGVCDRVIKVVDSFDKDVDPGCQCDPTRGPVGAST